MSGTACYCAVCKTNTIHSYLGAVSDAEKRREEEWGMYKAGALATKIFVCQACGQVSVGRDPK